MLCEVQFNQAVEKMREHEAELQKARVAEAEQEATEAEDKDSEKTPKDAEKPADDKKSNKAKDKE